MKQQDPASEAVDLAGEYVLGTLQGRERDQFEQRVMGDFGLQQEVADWEQRLVPLLDTLEPIIPPAAIWRNIEQRIDPKPPQERSGIWDSLNFWRNLGMATASLVLVLSLSLFGLRQETGELERLMVVMNDQSQAGWVIGTRGNDSILKVKAMQPTQLPKGKVCQLWMEREDGVLVPIGVLPHTGSMEMISPALLQQESRFKISIESAVQAPVARPSEEIVFEGKMTTI
ncbi:MAG: anti-sigma factor [Pseudomonadota bacterium]